MVRACDRCSRLKTQCNGDNPCNRCERLGLECTQTRPVLAKGRPRRESTDPRTRRSANDNRLQSASPQSSSVNVSMYNSASEQIQGLVRGLEDLPLSEAVAAFALESMFMLRTNIGVLIAILDTDTIATTSRESSIAPSQDTKPAIKIPTHSKALLYAIIYVGILSNALRDATNDLVELQQCVLNSVPALHSSARELLIEDALSLSLLSYTNCLVAGRGKSAEHWNALACSIARQQQESLEEGSPSPFYQKSLIVIVIIDRVMSLLHNRQASDVYFEVPDAPWLESRRRKDSMVLNKMSIVGVLDLPPDTTAYPYLNTDYFSLYSPLVRILDIALDRPAKETLSWKNALNELDQYILHFPPSLKLYETVTMIFHIEATIWYHGLFLLIFGGCDLHMYFHDHTHYTSSDFVHCMEHALLIGEILPTITQLMRSAIELSPATVYFVLLSSVIHGAALRLCTEYLSSNNRPVTAPRGVPVSFTGLLGSIVAHITLLRKIRESSPTSILDLVGEVESFTETIYNAAMSSGNAVDITMFNPLKSYRWTTRGLGIIKLEPKLTQELDEPDVSMSDYNESTNVTQRMAAAQEILALLDLHSRLSTPRRFCKSIRDS